MRQLDIVNGPNLGRLGRRQPEIYGDETFEDYLEVLRRDFPDWDLAYFQSNHEGAIVDYLEARVDAGMEGLVINPGALTHQSYVLRDCLLGLGIPALEVHMSQIYAREPFRAHSLVAPACVGQISGLGLLGYRLALKALMDRLSVS